MTKRILMVSHGIMGVTGFAKQLWLQSRALIETGEYEIFVAHRDYRGEPFTIPRGVDVKMQSGRPLDGMTILPFANQQWGEDIVPWYINKYKIDIVHTLGDIWCYQYLKDVPKKHPWKWLAHYVFDTENMVDMWNNSVKSADIAVVPSLNSFELVKSCGHKNVVYVPHGIDTNVYTPATNEEKMKLREEHGIPKDTFVIGMVAHNQYRKQVHRLIDAFEIFVKSNPNSLLLLHCLPNDGTGWDIPQLAKTKGISSHIMFTDKAAKGTADIHVPEHEMRDFYCMMDLHAISAGGEGFGIPIVEAMACGIPNVVTDYTTTKEFLCEKIKNDDGTFRYIPDRGLPVPYVDLEAHNTGGLWAKVNTKAMAEAFQFIKLNPGEARQMGMKARKFAVKNYDWDLVKKEWVKLYANFDNLTGEDSIRREEEFQKLRFIRVQ